MVVLNEIENHDPVGENKWKIKVVVVGGGNNDFYVCFYSFFFCAFV